MSLMPCPERCGRDKVSTTATSCPSCGCDVQAFLRTKLSTQAVGFPLDPIHYWFNWHFWYYGHPAVSEPVVAGPGWIEAGDPLVKLGSVSIRSPFSGLVLRKSMHVAQGIEVGYLSRCHEIAVIRPEVGLSRPGQEREEFEPLEISTAFWELIGAIEKAELGDNLMGRFVNRVVGFRSSFDKKGKFASSDELISAALKLKDVTAVWLPDWDFESGSTWNG